MNRESLTAYGLATAGAVQGLARYCRPNAAALAWGAILAYEMVAPPGELLSEGADRSLSRYPILTRVAIGVTALHLANLLPEKYDPLHRGLEFIKGR